MNKSNIRDGRFIDRLSSFLKSQGNLTVKGLSHIKHDVYQINTEGSKYILKGNKDYHILDQQLEFFKRCSYPILIRFVSFPNGEVFLYGFGLYWTLAIFQPGRGLDFSSLDDRVEAVSAIRMFHDDCKGIELPAPLIRPPLYLKWEQRLKRWKISKETVIQLGFEKLWKDIWEESAKQLNILHKLDWYGLEKKAVEELTWIHGDVAAHNFLHDGASGNTFLIDFDLLALSPQIYDWIQLGQRFLPYMSHDIGNLKRELAMDSEDWIVCANNIAFPSDLIREWWVLMSEESPRINCISYLDRLSIQWEWRRDFLKEARSML
ncbi:aminoglycoside phosphotransferase family protein [Sediminibacillus massiliensis]|uniref:aminoglycoside phosphotransferase family protein n=1 Tax=Sediminibacillus massiliensis TaxID=1926277 RepID=UPI0009FC494B|nr:aminoglycoside phosphotransferase family protein [Sediminibacillus massiliensis]